MMCREECKNDIIVVEHVINQTTIALYARSVYEDTSSPVGFPHFLFHSLFKIHPFSLLTFIDSIAHSLKLTHFLF